MSAPGPTFWCAFADFLANRPALVKDSEAKVTSAKGASFTYEYLSFPALVAALTPSLLAAGLAPAQVTYVLDGWLMLATTLTHVVSGERLESTAQVCRIETSGQDMGRLLTFHKRYELSTICMVAADEDDDAANVANGNGATTGPKPKSKPAKAAVSPHGENEQSDHERAVAAIAKAKGLAQLDRLLDSPDFTEAMGRLDSVERALVESAASAKRQELLSHQLSQSAGIAAKDPRFRAWVEAVHGVTLADEEAAELWQRDRWGVTSRSALDSDTVAGPLAASDLSEYAAWLSTGG